jgi:DnaJ-class molecular chaperone
MAEDPYSLLGVAKGASEDDIRRAFRKLAKELHPDVRPGDKAASERFKKVSAAYEFLTDADKRQRYDRGEIDEAGEPRRTYRRSAAGGAGGRGTGGPGGDFGFGDIFEDIFGASGGFPGGARPGGRPGAGAGAAGAAGAAGFGFRGQDVRYTLEVDFMEAVLGAKKRVTLPDGGQLDLTVPEGVTDGQTLRLRGKGQPGLRGGEAGDALVEIKVRTHPSMRREGDDIHVDVPIGIDEAILGAKIEVPTVGGRVTLTMPKGTSTGRVFRLKGKGVKNATTGQTGDQLVTVKIVLPETIDESLSYFMAEWKQRHPYDPRKR